MQGELKNIEVLTILVIENKKWMIIKQCVKLIFLCGKLIANGLDIVMNQRFMTAIKNSATKDCIYRIILKHGIIIFTYL